MRTNVMSDSKVHIMNKKKNTPENPPQKAKTKNEYKKHSCL